MNEAIGNGSVTGESKAIFEEWLKVKDIAEASKAASEKVVEVCEKDKSGSNLHEFSNIHDNF
jgi:hypothetical protein